MASAGRSGVHATTLRSVASATPANDAGHGRWRREFHPARDLAVGINALSEGITLDTLVAEDGVPDELFGTLVGLLVGGLIATAADQANPEKGHR